MKKELPDDSTKDPADTADEEKTELRDPSKARKFMAMLRSKTLPENVAATFEACKAGRGKTKRQEETAIINRYLKRNETGRLLTVPDHPYFKRTRAVTHTGIQEEVFDGVIFEEARTRVGGSTEDLKEACREGRIRTSGT